MKEKVMVGVCLFGCHRLCVTAPMTFFHFHFTASSRRFAILTLMVQMFVQPFCYPFRLPSSKLLRDLRAQMENGRQASCFDSLSALRIL